ncbi:unnamed protein product [Closterium sp. Yama58-4]|nr:unnamed protein product [Closterium sp. Yama58-4]
MTHGIPSYLTGHYPFATYGGQSSYHFGAPFSPMYGAPMHMPLPPHMPPHGSAHASAHGAAHGRALAAAHPGYGFPPPPSARHRSTFHAAAASGPTKRLRRTGRFDLDSMGHIPTPFFNESPVDVAIDGADKQAGDDKARFGSGNGGSGGDPLFDELSWGFPDLEFKPKLDSAAMATTNARNSDLQLSLEPTAISDHAPHVTHDDVYYSEYYPHPAPDYPPMASPYHAAAYYQPHPSHHPHPLYSHHLYKQRHAEAAAMARQARVAATREALAGRNGVQSVAGRNVKSPAVAQAKATGKRKGGDSVADPHTLGDGLEFDEQLDHFGVAVAANEPCAVVPSRADRPPSPADLLVPSSPSVPLLTRSSAETASAFPAASSRPSLALVPDREGPCRFSIHSSLPGDRDDAAPALLFPPVPRIPVAVSSPVVPSAAPSAAASIPATVDPKRRRLLRNRVSAQQAREKKKCYISGLEGREASLTVENEALEATIAALTKENAELSTPRVVLSGPKFRGFDGVATPASLLTSKATFSGGFSAGVCGTATPRLSGGRQSVIRVAGGEPGGAGKSAGGKAAERAGPTAETTPLVRFAWYASEAFGKAVAAVRGGEADGGRGKGATAEGEPAVVDRDAAIKALREDYDKSYFVTGEMTMWLYEPDCEFADPFVSFNGRDRFKQNVSNLGSFMEEVSLKILDWQESEGTVTTKWRFSCVLGLPWRPILAASGSTDHFFSESTGKIYKHVERWDISPADGVKQLLKPNPKLRKR